jgi:hypothetical protein
MYWWIALAVVVLALLGLGLAVLPVLARLSRLGSAAARTQKRVSEAETLQMSVAHLQERLAALSEQAADLATRGKSGNGR